MPSVGSSVDGHVATLTFDNSDQRGALTPEMLRQLRAQLADLERQHPQIRVVVLRGTGEVFSSGYAIDRLPDPDALAAKDEIEELCEAIEASPLVVLAMLCGVVVGAALDIASACDVRLAERSCRLGITPAKLGLVYSVAGCTRIHRLVGPGAARLLFYTADLVDARTAQEMGLVTHVHETREGLERETLSLAHRVASRAPLSVAGTKRILQAVEAAAHVDQGIVAELHDLRRQALGSPDCAEARAAFAVRRTPRFTGEK